MSQFDVERAAFFDELSATWDAMIVQPAPQYVRQLLAAVAIKPGDVVLDVGSGTGFLLSYMLQEQPAKIIACDISTKMLEVLANKYQGIGTINLLHADAIDLPLEDCVVDVVVCNGVYPHFADRAGTLQELYRVAKPGARIAVSHFGGRNFVNSIHAGHDHELIRGDLLETAEEVSQLLEQSGFTVSEMCDTEHFFLVGGMKADD